MKKFIAFILVIAMSISVLAGCSSSKEEETTNGKTTDSNDDSKVIDSEVITIDWMPQNDSPVDKDSPVIKALEEKLNVKFNFIYIDRNKEKEILNLRIASQEIPDVMRVYEDTYRAYIEQGVIAEIPEAMIKEYGPNLYDITIKNGGELAWEYPKSNDKLYGMPYLNMNGDYIFTNIWREDWLKNVGISSIPETLQEAEQAFYKFVNNDPNKSGKKDTYALSDKGMSSIFGAFGGIPYFSTGGGNTYTYSLKDGKVICTATMPEMKEALTVLNKWYKDGLIDPEFITGENKGEYWGNSIAFWNGQIGFSTPGLFYHIMSPHNENDRASSNYSGFHGIQGDNASYITGKPLVGPDGKSGHEKWGTYPGIYVVLGKQVQEDNEKMKKIIQINNALVSDYDTFLLAMYGVEGKHYKNIDGNITSIIEKNEMAGLGIRTNGIGYLGANNFDYLKKAQPVLYNYADKVGKYQENYNNIVWAGLPSDGYYKSTIYKKIMENYFMFITGERNLNDFDDFVQELNKEGLDKLLIEANEWYAKYH